MNKGKPFNKKVVSFGKYRGWKYEDLPTEYLEWFVKNSYDQMVDRKEWAVREIARRKILTPSPEEPLAP